MMRYSLLHYSIVLFQYFSAVFSLFLRVETGHQNIAINGRDPYYGHYTKIYFHNLTCINAIDIHCLKELTGAEEIDLLYSECQRGHWKVAHYTNSKHTFRLKEPIHAHKLLISSRLDLSIIDAQVESCSLNRTKKQNDCHRTSREHLHRHERHGSIIKAVDSSVDERIRYKRAAPSAPSNSEIPSGTKEVTDDIIVPRGSTLTIRSGAILKFMKNTGMIVYGKLHINGTSSFPVKMESKDRENYKWNGITFKDAEPGSVISYVTVSGAQDGITIEGGPTPYFNHVISENNRNGINIQNPSTLTHLSGVVTSNNEKNGIEYLGQV